MDNVMGIPYFILFMIRDIPIVIYEILARMKNHIDTKSWGYVPSWYIPIRARNSADMIKNEMPAFSTLCLLLERNRDASIAIKIPSIINPTL